MTDQTRLQVFVDEHGRHGNPLLVVSRSAGLSDAECTAIAARAGTSETVFIDDARGGRVRIFVPTGRIPFAGYPLIGTGWFLARQGAPVRTLTTDVGSVAVQPVRDTCSIVTLPGQGTPWALQQLDSTADLLAARADGPGLHDYLWAWQDETAGRVRARAFTSASGTPEDEATGSAAIELCAQLGRPLVITQGIGSRIDVEPDDDQVRLTGRVTYA